MLAEPRSKRNYTLVPKGKPLYEDETRFGTKLMQKMGWTKGSGLGRDGSGSKDFLRVRYKNDAKGLGFEARDDQWTQHEESFNGLLNTLNCNGEDNTNNMPEAKQVINDESENEAPRLGFGFQDTTATEEIKPKAKKVKLKEKISGVSLEEKSKNSRARVHYHKFTRGKDLSQYSEKDLANIFGKKVGEESHDTNSPQEEPDTAVKSDVQFLHTGISVSDYFKIKMQAKKNLLENGNTADASGCTENNSAKNEDQQDMEVLKKKKKSKKQKQKEDIEKEEIVEQKTIKKKEKKSKKDKHNDLEGEIVLETETQITNNEEIESQEKKPKKNKKSKNKSLDNIQPQEEQLENELEVETKKNKRKQKGESEDVNDVTDQPQKKKRKKNKKNENENSIETGTINEDQQTSTEIKQLMKNELKVDAKGDKRKQESESNDVIDSTGQPQKKKKKDKDETKSYENIIEIETINKDQKASKETKNMETKTIKLTADHEEASKVPIKNSNKNKKKDVSYNANGGLTKDLKLDEIEKLHNSYNDYTISSFCAEKFRNLNFNNFKGSTLSQVEGYGLSKDLQLKVCINKNDEQRILDLWKGVLDKYDHMEQPKNIYKHYVKEVIKARKMKHKRPKLYIKTWRRKNAFQIV